MTTSRSNTMRTRRTRRALLDAGRAVFADLGYAHTSTEAILRRAGVSRGALYYHFPDKTALFAVVFAEVCQEYSHAVRTSMQTAEGDTWTRFMASLGVWVERLGHPSVWRIVYVDGPVVLGRANVLRRAPDMQFLRSVLAQLQAEGAMTPLSLDLCIHLVRAMCSEAASYIAQAEEKDVARQDMTAGLRRLLAGLRLPQAAGDRV